MCTLILPLLERPHILALAARAHKDLETTLLNITQPLLTTHSPQN